MRKKLLLLGGTSISRQIVYAAHEMGIDVYVTDYYEDSPCKKLAEKSFLVSCTDIEGIVKLIKDENIDGVLTGYADVLLPSYVQICQKAGLPCYANHKAIDITTDKYEFKNLCRKYNIPVVDEYSLQQVVEDKVFYPILIKPVDNSGARGIYICHNRLEFEEYYPKAIASSPSKHVLIERFMTQLEATIFYYLHNGEIYLTGVSDRHMYKFSEQFLQLPVGYTFPSTNLDDYIKFEDENIKAMFHSLDMREGMVFIQTFNDNGKYIIYEMGYRLTGSLEHHLFEKVYGFNTLKAIIDYSVGNTVDVESISKIDIKNSQMANVTLLLSEGIIDHYEGIDDVLNIPGVLHIHTSYNEGQEIDKSNMGRLSQVGIRVLLYAESRHQLISLMDEIKNSLRVISTDGKDMIIRDYSYKEICAQ